MVVRTDNLGENMIGNGYYFVGVTVTYGYAGNGENGWSASLAFQDDGFVNDNLAEGVVSTEGTLNTRYSVRDSNGHSAARVVLENILRDAKRLGIKKVTDLGRKNSSDVILNIAVAEQGAAPYYEDIPAEDIKVLRDMAVELGFYVIENEH